MKKGGRFKNLFTGLTLAGMVFAIAGCGAGGETQHDSAETEQTTETGDTEAAETAEAEDVTQEQKTANVQDPQEWEWDVQDEETLRYAFAKAFGGRAGVCVPMAALSDTDRMAIVKDQFNSVTMENEMKPDTLLGNKPVIGEDGFPVLSFTVPDMMLKEIKAYNDTAGRDGRKIMVRGHVLVWHSQTPDWFFYEGYDVSGSGFSTRSTMWISLMWTSRPCLPVWRIISNR